MTVFSEVQKELDRLEIHGWEREAALAMADKVDTDGQAAAVKELRSLMVALGSVNKPVQSEKSKRMDDLTAKREMRRAEAIQAALSKPS